MKYRFWRKPQKHNQPESQTEKKPFFRQEQQDPENKAKPFFSSPDISRQEMAEEDVQTKGLTIGKPGDKYEQEADTMADRVVSNPQTNQSGVQKQEEVQRKRIQREAEPEEEAPAVQQQQEEEETPAVQQQQEEEEAPAVQQQQEEEEAPAVQQQQEEEEAPAIQQQEEEKEDTVQTKSSGSSPRRTPKGMGQRLQQRKQGGKGLSPDVRNQMESAFGRDFGGVRIHNDTEAQKMSKDIHAQAFTHGQDIYFNQGKFQPENSTGKRLLAHELTHVVQQGGADVKREDQSGANTTQTQQTKKTPSNNRSLSGVAAVVFLVQNPSLETNPALKASIKGLYRSSHVPVGNIVFKPMGDGPGGTALTAFDSFEGHSTWDGNTPVIHLPTDSMQVLADHVNSSSPSQGETLAKVYEVIRTIGHEIHHLQREKENNPGNEIQPVFDKEAIIRMEQVRQNWLDAIQRDVGNVRKELNIPEGKKIEKWTDVNQTARDKVEEGATQTDFIQGLYYRSAYLVEEIYAKIAEIYYLRIQQKMETDEKAIAASRKAVSDLAHGVYFISNQLKSQVQLNPNGLITPALEQKARATMLAHLKKKYPGKGGKDSYEVRFYLSATKHGMPPHVGN